jgi:hypothetical protein
MGAVKPWNLMLLMLCCLLPITAATAAGIWAARRKRR